MKRVAQLALGLLLITTICNEAATAARLGRGLGAAGKAGRVISGTERAAVNAEIARRLGLSERTVASVPETEARALNEALDDFASQSRAATGRYREEMELLEAAAALRAQQGFTGRTAPLSPNLPNLRVKLTASAAHDDVVIRFANARLRSALEQPFDARTMRVVALGLSEDGVRSAAEIARFRRSLARPNWDEVGPLANIGRWDSLSHADRVSLMTAYRGRTVIVVGHIDNRLNSFFVFRNGERVPVDIAAWSEAAAEAGVNFLPLGCNSSTLASVGAQGLINSGTVLRRISSVAATQPRNVGEFLRTLAGPDLVLVADPFDLRLFSSGLSFLQSLDGAVLGRIVIRNVNRQGNRNRQADAHVARYESCFVANSFQDFLACDQRIREHLTRRAGEREQSRRLDIRNASLVTANREIESVTVKHRRDRSVWPIYAIGYSLIFVLLISAIVHCLLGAGASELHNGFSLREFISRRSIIDTRRLFRVALDDVIGNRFIFIFIGGACVAAYLALTAPAGEGRFMWMAMFTGLGIGMAISFLVAAFQLRSISVSLGAPLVMLLALSTGAFAQFGGNIAEQRDRLRWRTEERNALMDLSPSARWRHEPVFVLSWEEPMVAPPPIPTPVEPSDLPRVS